MPYQICVETVIKACKLDKCRNELYVFYPGSINGHQNIFKLLCIIFVLIAFLTL